MIGKYICKIPVLGNHYRGWRIKRTAIKNRLYYNNRFSNYSLTFHQSDEAAKSEMIMNYHIIEKGLTMPNKRLGFGQPVVRTLIAQVDSYVSEYGRCDFSVKNSIGVIKEYYKAHDGSDVLDNTLHAALKDFTERYDDVAPLKQFSTSREEYFSASTSDFDKMALSRKTIRNLSGNISVEKIRDAVEIAMYTPSSCNRQPWRVHVVSKQDLVEECLAFQNGNRGFTHLINKLLVITVDSRSFGHPEMNDLYVNGGLFSMSLAYALYRNKIGSCMLNWSATPENDLGLREFLKIPEWEMVIMLVGCGIPPEDFECPLSQRKKPNEIISLH